MKTLRLFTGIPIPKSFFFQIKPLCDKFSIKTQLKYPSCENLHLTLHFFGGSSLEKKDQIAQILSLPSPAPLITIGKGGFFKDKKGKPRIVFLGVESPSLCSFYQKTAEILKKHNLYQDERSYKPHITLFRVKNKIPDDDLKNFIEKTKDISFSFTPDAFYLYQSSLHNQGTVYQKLVQIKFALLCSQ